MAEEDERMTIRTVFDLESYDRLERKALFKQRPPSEHLGSYHFWSMDRADWDALGRPASFVMTLSPEEPI
jgi:hypothetical protein